MHAADLADVATTGIEIACVSPTPAPLDVLGWWTAAVKHRHALRCVVLPAGISAICGQIDTNLEPSEKKMVELQ
jgi:hypothetical protein